MLIAGKKLTTSPLCFAAYHMQNQLFTFHFYVPDHDSYQYKTFSIYPHGCLTVKKKKMKERERQMAQGVHQTLLYCSLSSLLVSCLFNCLFVFCFLLVWYRPEAFVNQILGTMVLTFLGTYIPESIAEILF